MAAGTVALQRPVPNRDMKPRPYFEPNANQAPPGFGANTQLGVRASSRLAAVRRQLQLKSVHEGTGVAKPGP
jgi:hypothetical protein